MLKSTKISLLVIGFISICLLALSLYLASTDDCCIFGLPLIGIAIMIAPLFYVLNRDLVIRYGSGFNGNIRNLLED